MYRLCSASSPRSQSVFTVTMTRAVLAIDVLYSKFVHAVIPALRSGRIGPYQPCKAFGKLFTHMLTCTNGFLFTQSFV